MAVFKTQFDDHARVYANVGSREKVLYSSVFDDNGVMDLIEAGKENLYDYIQSFKDSVDINVILKRFAAGDTAALQRRQGMFGDFSDAPSNYAEALNSMIVAEQYFNSLPLDVRAKFDHNFHKFLVSLDNPNVIEMLGDNVVKPAIIAGKVDDDIGEAKPAPIETPIDTKVT